MNLYHDGTVHVPPPTNVSVYFSQEPFIKNKIIRYIQTPGCKVFLFMNFRHFFSMLFPSFSTASMPLSVYKMMHFIRINPTHIYRSEIYLKIFPWHLENHVFCQMSVFQFVIYPICPFSWRVWPWTIPLNFIFPRIPYLHKLMAVYLTYLL